MNGYLAAALVFSMSAAIGFWFRIGWVLAGSLLSKYIVDSQIHVHNHAYGGDITVFEGEDVAK